MLNYNGLKYLKRTIPPILKLDYPNYEFIIVDNGSTDGSIEFINKFKRIRLIKSPRLREKNFACNYAIKRAKGGYILLLDNDIIIREKRVLHSLMNNYYGLDKPGTLSFAYTNEGENLSKGYGCFFSYYFNREILYLNKNQIININNIKVGSPAGIGLFIKSSLWKDLGGYDDNLIFGGDDNDLGIKVWLMGYKNYLYSKTIQTHLGFVERQDNKKYPLRFKEIFYAHLYTVVKDFKFFNMVTTILGHSTFMFLKSIKQSFSRRHLGPFISFFQGYFLFLKNLPVALKKRKEIQSKRVIKEDIFLKIRPPKFD
jgi:GT2 family glycosyltransferase